MSSWGHWKNPVIYMSRATTGEVWQLMYGTEADLTSDLRFGLTQIPVLFDDRMPLGEARLEESPEKHYPLWRDIGWYDLTEGPDIIYAEIEVCGLCVPKHSHFARRDLVPEWPCAAAERRERSEPPKSKWHTSSSPTSALPADDTEWTPMRVDEL